jgi:hypothetical protein
MLAQRVATNFHADFCPLLALDNATFKPSSAIVLAVGVVPGCADNQHVELFHPLFSSVKPDVLNSDINESL